MTGRLPDAFAEFERFAGTWCLATEAERYAVRLGSTMADMIDFHDAFLPRLEEAIELCNAHALGELPEEVMHLLQLVYSMIMVAMSVEIFSQPKTVDSADAVLVRVGEPTP